MASRDLESGGQAGQRGAQLMRGVGDEAALAVHRQLQRLQHGVQRAAQPGKLISAGSRGTTPHPPVGRVEAGQSATQITAGRDRRGLPRNRSTGRSDQPAVSQDTAATTPSATAASPR